MNPLAAALNPGNGWAEHLAGEFEAPYMQALAQFLMQREQAGATIFPAQTLCFNALNFTPLASVKVVILGQDPYHGPGQAHGLSFSVPPGVRPPPSLQNIYKEIHDDLGVPVPQHGCLNHWAEQGVLLLNSVLTVEQGQAGSHQGKGWEAFTDAIVRLLNEVRDGLVFLLWGSYAQNKGRMIDAQRHCVLKSVHPSPLSAHRGFLGCRHFSQANDYLVQRGEAAIDWSLPDVASLQQGFRFTP